MYGLLASCLPTPAYVHTYVHQWLVFLFFPFLFFLNPIAPPPSFHFIVSAHFLLSHPPPTHQTNPSHPMPLPLLLPYPPTHCSIPSTPPTPSPLIPSPTHSLIPLTSEKLGRPKSSSVTSSNSAKGNSITAEGGRGEDATPEDTPPSHQEQLLEGYLREAPNELAVQGEPPRVTFAIEAGSSPESYNFEQNGCERQPASAERQASCERNEEAEH